MFRVGGVEFTVLGCEVQGLGLSVSGVWGLCFCASGL